MSEKIQYETKIISGQKQIGVIHWEAILGDVRIYSGICSDCLDKFTAYREFTKEGYITKSKKCSCTKRKQ